jgi:hypothetical protein
VKYIKRDENRLLTLTIAHLTLLLKQIRKLFIISIPSFYDLESFKMTSMDKIIHKVEEKIENKLHNGNGQQHRGGYVSLPHLPLYLVK